jgi:hypothetical protein
MKKIIITTFILAAVLLNAKQTTAQDDFTSNTSLMYTFGVPFGSLDEHTGNWSGRGVTLEYQKDIAENFSVGLNISYSVFCEQKGKDTYTLEPPNEHTTLTAVQYNYNNIVPILVTGNYTFGMGAIGPYVGLGIGTLYDLRNTNMGLYTIEEHNWHLAMSPQAGFLFDTGAPVSLKVAFKYDHAFKIDNSDGFGMLQMSIGIAFLK